jgi:hypothetical protein
MNATASGVVAGSPVHVELRSAVQPGTNNRRLGSITVTSPAGAGLETILASQSSLVRADMGFPVPMPPAAGYGSGNTTSVGEVVYDSAHGLRMVNISLASSARLALSDLARRVGFQWLSANEGTEVLAFTGPQLYYIPSKPGAPPLVWSGRTMPAGELGITALVDVPPLGVAGVRATLLVQRGGMLTLQVS